MATEEAKYAVELKEQSFEVRMYEPHILAEISVDGDFEGAGNKAFRRLFKYISGNNKSREKVEMASPVVQGAASEKVEMTSPVVQGAASERIEMTLPLGQQTENGRWAVSFMMPSSYSWEALPEPEDAAVILRQIPARRMAAVRYSGFWSENAYRRNKARLEAWMGKKGLRVTGEPIWARYNPPFMPWLLRRNEILVPVANLPIPDVW